MRTLHRGTAAGSPALPVCALVAMSLCLCGCKEESDAKWSRLPGTEATPRAQATRPPAPPPAPGAEETSSGLVAAGVLIPIPADWVREEPRSRMRLAQYRLPGPGASGEMAIHCFGIGQGGPPAENIDRWTAQFVTDAGGPAEATTATREQQGLRLWTVQTRGTYHPGMGGEPKTGHAMFGVIIEGGPEGMVFLKATGPVEVIEQNRAAFDRLLDGIAPR